MLSFFDFFCLATCIYTYIWFVCLSYIVQLYLFTYVLTPKNTHGYVYYSYVCISVPQQFISGSHQSISYFEKYFPSWWLNQPIWKISSKWEGVKINIWNHQVVPGQAKSYPVLPFQSQASESSSSAKSSSGESSFRPVAPVVLAEKLGT